VTTSSEEEISQEDAIESLGKKASRYVVHSWDVEGATEEEDSS